MNIYAGNLSRDVSSEDLQQAFGEFGKVTSATVIKDKFTDESKGFGFVEMPSKDEAMSAIANLNGKQIKGRSINVNEARPKTDNRRRDGGHQGARRY